MPKTWAGLLREVAANSGAWTDENRNALDQLADLLERVTPEVIVAASYAVAKHQRDCEPLRTANQVLLTLHSGPGREEASMDDLDGRFDERHPEQPSSGRRCHNLTIRDDETIDELVARTGLSREAAAELIDFAERIAARKRGRETNDA